MAEMNVQGVSTRKVKAITEEFCGRSFPASAISAVNKTPDVSEVSYRGAARVINERSQPVRVS